MAWHGKIDMDVLALSLLAAAEASHSFSAHMPSRFTTRTLALEGSPDEVKIKVANLRSGYAPALTFGLALGGIVSILAKSPLPLIFSAAASALMVAQYEGALPAEMRLTGAEHLEQIVDQGAGWAVPMALGV